LKLEMSILTGLDILSQSNFYGMGEMYLNCKDYWVIQAWKW